MVRSATVLLALLLAVPQAARARAKRPPKPRLLLTLTVVKAPATDQALAQPVERALHAAIDAAPLAIRSLGFDPQGNAKRLARELRRRGLLHYALQGSVTAVTHRVVARPGGKALTAEATVTLRCRVPGRKRATEIEVQGKGTSTTAISVVLQGEVLASRIEAGRAAARQALAALLQKLLPKKKPRRRRR